MVIHRSLALLVLLPIGLGACALVLGFEDHELFPPMGGAGGAPGGSGGAGGVGGQPTAGSGGGVGGQVTGGAAGSGGAGGEDRVAVLLIPDASEDSVGIYDPVDGHYLGDFIPPYVGTEPYELVTPHNATQGPDGRIYLSDQVADAIYRFEPDGAFVDVVADATDGLDNVRGIDFRDDEIFVSVSPAGAPAFVARFDLEGHRLADFVADDSDPFDVHFVPTRTMLLANIETPDDVRLYDVNAATFDSLLPIDFPQQIQSLPSGTFLVGGWTEAIEFGIDGTIVRTLGGLSGTSGIYPLDSGDWLVSSDDGLQVFNPYSQQVVQTSRVGSWFMKIERALLPVSVVEAL